MRKKRSCHIWAYSRLSLRRLSNLFVRWHYTKVNHKDFYYHNYLEIPSENINWRNTSFIFSPKKIISIEKEYVIGEMCQIITYPVLFCTFLYISEKWYRMYIPRIGVIKRCVYHCLFYSTTRFEEHMVPTTFCIYSEINVMRIRKNY